MEADSILENYRGQIEKTEDERTVRDRKRDMRNTISDIYGLWPQVGQKTEFKNEMIILVTDTRIANDKDWDTNNKN